MGSYKIYYSGDGAWVVQDADNCEVCVCNTYEGEKLGAQRRAQMIADSLNGVMR